MTFARIFGTPQVPIAGSATGWTANLSGYQGVVPLAVPKDSWQVGQQVYLKVGAGQGVNGNYQALALGGPGANTYEQNLEYGYQGWIRVDDWVETKSGNMVGPTERAISYRINQDPYATYDSFSRRSPRLVIVPIVDSFDVHGRSQVHVMSFGLFFLEPSSDGKGPSSAAAPDFGAYVTKLTQ